MSYAPYLFNDINIAQAHGSPNQLYMDSAIYDYWVRALYQRMTSIFEWKIPETWEGNNKDFLNWLLFSTGFVGVINTEKYGYIFQPCQPGATRDIMYQINSFIVTNPYDAEISKEYKCGEDGEFLKLTPDYKGTFDIINFYASRLAFLYTSINSTILKERAFTIYAARSKTGAQALKILESKKASGDPFIILDKDVMWPDAKTKDDAIFDISPDDREYKTDKLLASEVEILREFDTAIGIPNINEKKERLVTSEAESNMLNSTATAFVWFDCLKDSISKIKKLYPDIELDVELRYGAAINETSGEDNIEEVDDDVSNDGNA